MKERVFSEAKRLFLLNGFAVTELRDVARAAQTPTILVRIVCGSRDALALEIIRSAQREFQSYYCKTKSPTCIDPFPSRSYCPEKLMEALDAHIRPLYLLLTTDVLLETRQTAIRHIEWRPHEIEDWLPSSTTLFGNLRPFIGWPGAELGFRCIKVNKFLGRKLSSFIKRGPDGKKLYVASLVKRCSEILERSAKGRVIAI